MAVVNALMQTVAILIAIYVISRIILHVLGLRMKIHIKFYRD